MIIFHKIISFLYKNRVVDYSTTSYTLVTVIIISSVTLGIAIFPVSDVRKERYAKVKAILRNGKNGKNSDEANIHFMPFN